MIAVVRRWRSLVALALLSCSATPATRPIEAPGEVRAPAPSLEGGKWLNAEPVTLEGLRGHVVVLAFWRRGSVESLHALADLSDLGRQFADRPVAVVGVHPGDDRDSDGAGLARTLERHGFHHPVVVDSTGSMAHRYEVQAWPTLVVIDVEGRVFARWAGEPEPARLAAAVERLLAEGARRGALAARRLDLATPALPRNEALSFPTKIAVAATGQVAIADTGHHRIVVVEADGTVVDVAGSGLSGSVDGAFDVAAFRSPQGLAFDESGRVLYVADTDDHRLRRLDLDARTVTTLAGTGERAAKMTAGPALQVALRSPRDLALDGDDLYVAMAGVHSIWRLTGGRLEPFAGSGREGARDGKLAEASFSQPSGLTIAAGVIYVADAGTSAIRAISTAGVTTVARGREDASASWRHLPGIGARGDELYLAFDDQLARLVPGQPVETVASELGEPEGLATLPDGRLVVADTHHHQVVLFDPASGAISPWPLVGLSPPTARGVVVPTRVQSGRPMAVRAQGALGPGRNTLVIDLLPPPGGKLTEGAPIVVEARATGEGVAFPEPRLRSKVGAGVPPLRLPLDLAPDHRGGARLVIDYFWCTTADAGACIPAQAVLDVSFATGATPGEARIAVQAEETPQ